MTRLIIALAQALLIACLPSAACAHDPSTYGGLFRTRNLGHTWLNADVGLFVNAAITVAVDPRDANNLLLGTDTGLLGSRNGGRNWTAEARDLVVGPVFAVAFSADGRDTICAAPSGVLRFHDGQWIGVSAPTGAAPARAVAFGKPAGRAYLLGDRALFASDDGGASFRTLPSELADATVLAVGQDVHETLFVVAGGRLLRSENGGTQWTALRIDAEGAAVDTAVADPASPQRLWAGSADRIHVSDDRGSSWRAVGAKLPEPDTSIRGIAADAAGTTLMVTTHRGMYRSEDGGSTWALKEGNLPIHLESGPIVRDPSDALTLYAVYSLMPYPQVWRTALEGGNLLSRADPLSLAGGLAFILLMIIGGAFIVANLDHRRSARAAPRNPVS